MVVGSVPRKRLRDRKVTETRLTVLSDQDVVLRLSISVRVHSILYFTYRADAAV